MSLALLDRASVGRPITRAGVSLFPLYLHQEAGSEIVTGADAPILITELPTPDVPSLLVTSHAKVPVLLVEGETLKGGQQQRTLNVSVLVPALGALTLPVSCVEQGRWHGGDEFARGGSFAPRRVRRIKQATVADHVREGSRHADQMQVWDAVSSELDLHGAYSDTGALEAAEASLTAVPRLDAVVDELVGRGPLPQQSGIVVAHGARVVGVEVFACAELLSAHWEAIVRAALLDAPAEVHGKPSAARALRFLHHFATSAGNDAPGVGLGREQHVRTRRLVGQGLSLDGRLVHSAAFALAA